MKKLLINPVVLSVLLLILMSFSHHMAKEPLRIKLVPFQKGTELWTEMTIRNQSAQPIYLNKIDIGQSNRLLNNLFVIKQQQEVNYTGVLVKRRAPTADDFVLLKPGESVQSTIRLDESYAFLPGKHRYSIQYRHYHGSPNDQTLLQEVKSGIYTFSYTAGK
jgi:hypothetical protein